MGCNGFCSTVEQISEFFLDGFVIHLGFLCQKQAGSGFNSSPRQAAASVFSAPYVAAQEASPS